MRISSKRKLVATRATLEAAGYTVVMIDDMKDEYGRPIVAEVIGKSGARWFIKQHAAGTANEFWAAYKRIDAACSAASIGKYFYFDFSEVK